MNSFLGSSFLLLSWIHTFKGVKTVTPKQGSFFCFSISQNSVLLTVVLANFTYICGFAQDIQEQN
jgi:hypothetical protein